MLSRCWDLRSKGEWRKHGGHVQNSIRVTNTAMTMANVGYNHDDVQVVVGSNVSVVDFWELFKILHVLVGNWQEDDI